MSEIEQYSIISGKVVDSNGNPLPKTTVTISTGKNTKTHKTNKDGEYSFKFPSTEITQGNIKLDYFLNKYTTKSITSVYQTSETKTEKLYDVPRVTLTLMSDPSQQLISQVNQDLNKQENDLTKLQLPIPTEARLANIFNNKKETIKNLLIPFVIGLILEFGTTAAQDIINKQLPQSFDCPSSAKIQELIKKRNNLVKQLNNLYSSITVLTKTLQISGVLATALNAGIKIITSLPYPAIGIPVAGLPPLTSGVIEITGTAKDKLIQTLNKAGVVISILTITLGTIGALLGTIIQILNQLDGLLAQCAENQNMDLEQLNNEINALANPTVVATQSENNTYKGFKLEVKINENNTSKFIQRFAQAANKQGVPVLKTEPSFASDPAVLISQLKFIIDSNPNITAE
jgi:hypothetical protein